MTVLRFVGGLLLALLALLFVLFAVSNRESVAVGLWPLPVVVEVPLFFVALVALLVGFVLGELAAWVAARRWRREVRRRGRRIEALENELGATQAQLQTTGEPPSRLPART